MANKDLYKIIGVEKTASEEEIKKSYRKKAIQYHPDKNPGNKESEEKFKELSDAYSILSDPEKKVKYDRGEMDGNFGRQGFGGGGSMDDLFKNFSFGSDGFNFFGGGGRRGQHTRQTRRGNDLRIKVSININEIITGVHKKISINRDINCQTCSGTGAKNKESIITCSKCSGSGQVYYRQQTNMGLLTSQVTCPSCNGNGEEIKEKCHGCHGNGLISHPDNIEFNIPAGAVQGISLSLKDFGSEAKGGGINGNLIIDITEIEHPVLKRENNNIISDVFISYHDAVMGNDSLEMETVDGLVTVKIDPGTESGKILRLKEKGIPDINNPIKRGDQLAFINIFVPKNLTEEEQMTVSKLSKIKTAIPDKEKTQHIKGVYSRIKEYEDLY